MLQEFLRDPLRSVPVMARQNFTRGSRYLESEPRGKPSPSARAQCVVCLPTGLEHWCQEPVTCFNLFLNCSSQKAYGRLMKITSYQLTLYLCKNSQVSNEGQSRDDCCLRQCNDAFVCVHVSVYNFLWRKRYTN